MSKHRHNEQTVNVFDISSQVVDTRQECGVLLYHIWDRVLASPENLASNAQCVWINLHASFFVLSLNVQELFFLGEFFSFQSLGITIFDQF